MQKAEDEKKTYSLNFVVVFLNVFFTLLVRLDSIGIPERQKRKNNRKRRRMKKIESSGAQRWTS
jgi:hypothetical protein